MNKKLFLIILIGLIQIGNIFGATKNEEPLPSSSSSSSSSLSSKSSENTTQSKLVGSTESAIPSSSSSLSYDNKIQKVQELLFGKVFKFDEHEKEEWASRFYDPNKLILRAFRIRNVIPLKLLASLIDLNKPIASQWYPDSNKWDDFKFPLELVQNEEQMKTLVDAGANINQKDEAGDTLLIRQLYFEPTCKHKIDRNTLRFISLACLKELNLNLIRLLLRAGADPNIPNNAGKTFFSILEEKPIANSQEEKEFKNSQFDEIRKTVQEESKILRKAVTKEIKQSKDIMYFPPGLAEEIASYVI